jgi:hypothetical protein
LPPLLWGLCGGACRGGELNWLWRWCWEVCFRRYVGEQDSSRGFAWEDDEAGLSRGQGGIDRTISGMDLGGTASEAADYGFRSLVVECNPANHRETYSSP